MLFIQSNNLAAHPDAGTRLRLLDALTAHARTPLIGAARQQCFALLAAELGVAVFGAAAEFARRSSVAGAARDGNAYTPGELFCTDDCILFLVFGARIEEGISAGIIYSIDTREPLLKLERFCHDVRAALFEHDVNDERAPQSAQADLPRWQPHVRASTQGLARFMAIQPTDFAVTAKCRSSARDFVRAAALLEEQGVRLFLRRVQEMRREGYTPRRLFAEAERLGGVSVRRMLDAGLLEREVRVSCRQSGHALFDLPTSDSLAAITISKAKCSQCAAPVADEVIEETINPTPLAVSLLADGYWLNNRVYQIIRTLGVPASEIATGPVSAHGESYLAADVCGNSFLFVTKDGDLTPAFSRRIAETIAETGATHLVVLITGHVEDEGRLRLYEFTWRRARDGQDLDTNIIEGLRDAEAEIERTFARALHRELTHTLFSLDAALGFSASDFVLNWFRLRHAPQAADIKQATQLFDVGFEHVT